MADKDDLKSDIEGMVKGTGSIPTVELEDDDNTILEGAQDGQGQEGEQGRERGDSTAGRGQEGSEEVTASGEPKGEEETELTPEQRYENLLQLYNQQSAQVLELQSRVGKPPVAAQEPPVAPVQPQQPAAPAEPIKLNKEALQRALIEDDADAFMEALSPLLQQQQPQIDVEQLLLRVAQMSSQVADQRLNMMLAVRDFYDKNQDLQPYMPIVGNITNEIASKNPDKSLVEILELVETEARKQLSLKKQITQSSAGRGKPTFASSSNTRKPGAPKIDGLQGDIKDMIGARH